MYVDDNQKKSSSKYGSTPKRVQDAKNLSNEQMQSTVPTDSSNRERRSKGPPLDRRPIIAMVLIAIICIGSAIHMILSVMSHTENSLLFAYQIVRHGARSPM